MADHYLPVDNSAPLSWTVGDVRITKVIESLPIFRVPDVFPEGTAEDLLALPWLQPHFALPDGRGLMSMHALVVDAPGRRIIVDTCVGNGKDRAPWRNYTDLDTPFLQDLEAAGFPRESFDAVLCTHMHIDHVGWNTMLVDGEWVPTFPNARYLLDRTEFEFWSKPHAEVGGDVFDAIQDRTFADSIQPLLDRDLVDLVEGHHALSDEISLVPTPGHSPGHVSVRISSRGQEALITGDMTHHPCQLAHPDWGLHVDYDSAAAAVTRREMFGRLADEPVLVIGTHWPGVTAGWIKREGAAYRLEW